jgi:hypothetical protein
MPGPSSLTSILDEVRDDLVQALLVGAQLEVGRLDRHRHRNARRVELRLAHGLVQQHLNVEGLPVERHDARFEAGEIEQLLHEPAEPLHLRQHRAQRRGVGRFDAVDEVLEHDLERGDRRAQLVAHVGDEVAA